MEIAEALRATLEEGGLRVENVAVAANVSSQAVVKWIADEPGIPTGENVLRLMRSLPGFAEKLGFQVVRNSAVA